MVPFKTNPGVSRDALVVDEVGDAADEDVPSVLFLFQNTLAG